MKNNIQKQLGEMYQRLSKKGSEEEDKKFNVIQHTSERK